MPMGNGTGPSGMGPRTGRGAGFCNGYNMPGSYNRGGRGCGNGFGRFNARGRGFGHGFGYAAGLQNSPADAAGYYNQPVDTDAKLRAEAEYLEERLRAVNEQLDKMNKDTE